MSREGGFAMKKIMLSVAVIVICIFAVIMGLRFFSDGNKKSNPMTGVAIVVPVNISAINAFSNGVKSILSENNIEVKEFSAEGDPTRFESALKAAVLSKPEVLILFGTQLSETALGHQFLQSLPKTIASGISAPEKIEALLAIGLSPPRKRPVAIVTDSPRRDIYSQSAAVIKEMIQGRDQVVGILYNESEKNSKETASRLKKALEPAGMVTHLGALTGADDVITTTKALIIKGCNLLVIPHDKYALPKAAAVVKLCTEASPEKPIPVFSLDDGVVRDSGVAASVSISYANLGRTTGHKCLEILRGTDPASMPVVALDEASIFVNLPAIQRSRILLSSSTMKQAIVVDVIP
jgi:putative tryptophan/tyrosine transport system substrate-binding protein